MFYPCFYMPTESLAFGCMSVTGWFIGMLSILFELITEFPVIVFLTFLLVLAIVELRKLKEKTNG